MDGLECSEILLSEIRKENDVFRFDAEYFGKLVLETISKVNSINNRMLKLSFDISKLAGFEFTKYFTPLNMNSTNSYIALTSKNIQPNNLVLNEHITIDKTVADMYLKRSALKEKDIVLSYTGEYRRALTLFQHDLQLGPNVCRLTPTDSILNSHYTSIFLNCRIGQLILDREKTLSAQPTVAMSRIRKIKVPLFNELQPVISSIVEKCHLIQEKAKVIYSLAQEILQDYLRIPSFKKDSVAIVGFKKTISSGRLDAEYYQPKYEMIAQKLNTRETVLSLCNLYDKNVTPDEKQTYQYIELADVGQAGDISDVDIQYGIDLPARARRVVKTGQIIVSSVEGSLQSCALITDEYDGALCSTGFYVLDSDYINSETLLVLFKSAPIQALMKQRCSGTILTAISKDELLSMPLPMIDAGIQKEIAAKVQESFALRKQSKQLLEYAKQAVEMAIERGEDVALEWLKDKVG